MCDTTTDWATHISTECATGGSAQCDGYCVEHGKECTCSCHNAWDLPQTVAQVRDWHDDLNDVVASFEKGDATEQWSEAEIAREALTKENPSKSYKVLPGQNRTVIAERY